MKNLLKQAVLPALVCAALFAAGLCAGSVWIPFSDFGGNEIVSMRAVRLWAAFAAGGSLALSGLVFQAILRNPLAEPFTLGLSGGAAVGAAAAFLTGASLLGAYTVDLFAFAGAILILALVLLISRGGRRGAETLLLSGVIAGTVMSGLLMFLISGARNEELAGITWWMLGDLQGVDPVVLQINTVLLAAVAFCFLFFAGDLDALSLGEAQAFDLGVRTHSLLILLTLLAALLAAGTVAMCGIIGFCGLVVPHAVRRIFGAGHRGNILPALFCGGGFLMLCDILSRLGERREIPVGVITALIGGPVFLWILNRRRSGDD